MPGSLREGKEKQFFFKKKNQKTFVALRHGLWPRQRPRPGVKKVFLLLFLQKKKRLTWLPFQITLLRSSGFA
jgi:hypothetical protein